MLSRHCRERLIHTQTFSMRFPNAESPHNGIFAGQRLIRLLESGCITTTVLAPVPWFPVTRSVFGKGSRYAKILPVESRGGVNAHQPRFPLLPNIGMTLSLLFFARAMRRWAGRIVHVNRVSLIEVLYFSGTVLLRFFSRNSLISRS